MDELEKPTAMLTCTADVTGSKKEPVVSSEGKADALHSKLERMRGCVIREIVETEETYLKQLQVVTHEIKRVMKEEQRSHPEFSNELIRGLFSNVDELLGLHFTILNDVKQVAGPSYNPNCCVAKVFLRHQMMLRQYYSTYGSDFEQAQLLLQEIAHKEPFKSFFQQFLVSKSLVNTIPNIQSFMLAPVQRVCKYPLLLQELMKNTPEGHPDYSDTEVALSTMKEVCSVINEARRRVEKMEDVLDWQASVDQWEGTKVSDSCNELILSDHLVRLKDGGAFQELVVFLFDQLIVFCRPVDKSKRSRRSSYNGHVSRELPLQYKAQIPLDGLEIEDIPDGLVVQGGVDIHVTNAWRMLNKSQMRKYLVMAKSEQSKHEWMTAILREREKVHSFKVTLDDDKFVVFATRGERIYNAMSRARVIRGQKSSLRPHSNCFLGTEFVQFLVDSKECSTVKEAVQLGVSLVSNGILHHVDDKHHFKNENLLYRFRYDDGTYHSRRDELERMSKMLYLYIRMHMLFTPLIRTIKTRLGALIARSSFSGKDLVDYLIAHGDVVSRDKATSDCERMFTAGFLHCVDERHCFKDREDRYYRFSVDADSKVVMKKEGATELFCMSEFLTRDISLPPGETDPGFMVESSQPTYVHSVDSKGLAAQHGLVVGDVLKLINGRKIVNLSSDEVMHLLRDGSRWRILTILTKPDRSCSVDLQAEGSFGFTVRGDQHVVVDSVFPNSPASRASVVPGMALSTVNGFDVSDAGEMYVKELLQSFTSEEDDRSLSSIVPPSPPPSPQSCPPEVARCKGESSRFRTNSPATLSVDSLEMNFSSLSMSSTANSLSYSSPSLSFGSLTDCSLLEESFEHIVTPSKKDSSQPVSLQFAVPSVTHNVLYKYNSSTDFNVSVAERLKEALPWSFHLPAKLYTHFAREDEQLLRQLAKIHRPSTTSPGMDNVNQAESLHDNGHVDKGLAVTLEQRIESLRQQVRSYQQLGSALLSHTYPGFKSLKEVNSFLYLSCPMNCHIHELDVSTHNSSETSAGVPLSQVRYHTVCAGLPSAVQLGARHGLQSSIEPVVDSVRSALRVCSTRHPDLNAAIEQFKEAIKLQLANGGTPAVSPTAPSKRDSIGSFDMDGDSGAGIRPSLDPIVAAMDAFRRALEKFLNCCESEAVVHSFEITKGLPLEKVTNYEIRQLKASVRQSNGSPLGDLNSCWRWLQTTKDEEPEISRLTRIRRGLMREMRSARQQLQHQSDKAYQKTIDHLEFITAIVHVVSYEMNQRLSCALMVAEEGCLQRRDAVFSQALSLVMSGFYERLDSALADLVNNSFEYGSNGALSSTRWLEQLASCGLFVQFDSLVNIFSEELAMLEDAVVAVKDLQNVTIQLKRLTDDMKANVSSTANIHFELSGTRVQLAVILYLDEARFNRLPPAVQLSPGIHITACLISTSINNSSTQKDVSSTKGYALRVETNRRSLELMQVYYRKLKSFMLDKSRLPQDKEQKMMEIDRLMKPLNMIDHQLATLAQTLQLASPGSKYQSASMLVLANDIANRCGAVRVTCCKTGAYSTAMHRTLDMAILLCRCHDLQLSSIISATQIFRSHGTFLAMLKKNELKRSYVFTHEPVSLYCPPTLLLSIVKEDVFTRTMMKNSHTGVRIAKKMKPSSKARLARKKEL